MAVENDLTAEERAEFGEHGVTFTDDAPAIGDVDAAAAPIVGEVLEPAVVTPEPAVVTPEPAVLTLARDPATGQFVTPAAEPGIDPVTGRPSAPVAGAPPPGFVPHAALHAERQRYAELARGMQTAQSRMNAMLASQRTDPEPLPDPEQQPIEFLEALGQRVVEIQQARQEETQHRQIDNSIEQDEATFQSYTPDYPMASNHYVQSRAAELLLTHSREATQQIMTNEVRQIANAAWQKGIPAAQMIYDIAKSRGYVPGAPTPTPTPTPAPAPAALTPAAVVAAAAAGKQQARSLSGPGGGAAKELDASALLAMTDDEFADYMKLGSKGANARFEAIAGR